MRPSQARENILLTSERRWKWQANSCEVGLDEARMEFAGHSEMQRGMAKKNPTKTVTPPKRQLDFTFAYTHFF
jgi:hypothetical protein